jgi:ADP-glucose type glycogen/starch synthase
MGPSDQKYFPLAIQVSERARAHFDFPVELLHQPSPSLLRPLQQVARSLNRRQPERPASAAQLNLLALLNRIFRLISGRFLELHNCTFEDHTVRIDGEPAAIAELDAALESFVRLYPPAAVLRGKPRELFFKGEEAQANRRDTLVELFILAVQCGNPAAERFSPLYDDADLQRTIAYRQALAELDRKLQKVPVQGLLGRSLLALLRAPIEASPHSLTGQVAFIRDHWGDLIPEDLLRSLLIALDVVAEEETMRGLGGGPALVPEFRAGLHYDEPEAFSPDTDWMPNVVLIAKTIYVWLDQLSKKYRRNITRLDQIPDEELDLLSRWGFTSLWLIGLWERSPASQKIKQIMGNPEAVSSAYSLYDYTVAGDLGGEDALAALEARCLARGICLASDVVPNHTGIYSRWTREHPDWYIQVDQPPYIGYRFTGPDLSWSDDVALFIEDGYWNHSDAAVVFKHVDRGSGKERYIYHGNDGTHMPWNDTAQLNYLLPEVREAMIRTIVAVARRFRVIRFDAAMTLAKKHFQRLWYPQPGGGSGVPSRAEHAMSRDDFDHAFPVEFWREVVDRVAAEVPDTLLIAEAFWLMEGYFVRTLGMHRVYNSAFMNMLKMEENAKYRSVIKNILEFNPAILQRFVNFMNNPDEATAVEQFGRGDKYFGVAVMLVTMPGLPMFGHGQVEGLAEKYGMEYRRAYRDEAPDEAFIRHHEAQIFPLMRRRRQFSGAEQFELYDFDTEGGVDENVFAYSNGSGEEKTLVVYNNRFGDTEGRVGRSVAKNAPQHPGETRMVTTTLAEAFHLATGSDRYLRFRDTRSGLEYLRPCGAMTDTGLHLRLGAYQYYAFVDFRQIHDAEGIWGQLYGEIGDRPVVSLDWELRRVRLAPLLQAFKRTIDPPMLHELAAALGLSEEKWRKSPAQGRFSRTLEEFLRTADEVVRLPGQPQELHRTIMAELSAIRSLLKMKSRRVKERQSLKAMAAPWSTEEKKAGELRQMLEGVLLPFLTLHRLAQPSAGVSAGRRSARWMEDYLLEHVLEEVLGGEKGGRAALLAKTLVRHQEFWAPAVRRHDFATLLKETSVRQCLCANWADGTEWFNKECLEELSYGLFFVAAIASAAHFGRDTEGLLAHLAQIHGEQEKLLRHAEEAGYRMERFRNRILADQRALYPPRKRKTEPLKILLVSPEVAPFAKSGGLADVAGALPQALKDLGHDVRIIMPFYRCVDERGASLERRIASVEVDIGGEPRGGLLHQGVLNDVPVYYVENPHFFDREGLYGNGDGDFSDNALRFGFFCRSVLEFLPRIGFRPDVLHLNDWQTGLIPVLLRTELRDDPFYAGIGALMTVHNLGYQGLFPPGVLSDLGLDPALASMEGLEFYGKVSFLKGGVIFADTVNTVSETYCKEIQTPELGIGFDGILRRRRDALIGIVNGLDMKQWNPAEDRALAAPFSNSDPEGKVRNKTALQQELGLEQRSELPIVAMVTRLDTQKGLDLVEDAWEELMQRDLQFVLLGSGERVHMERFAKLRSRYPGKVSINLNFDEDLSRRIYAGSDIFLMPSHYEPCGLGQLIALRYGSLPVVRRTGGLADTVFDPEEKPQQGNGFVFDEPAAEDLLTALDRALRLYADRPAWLSLARQAMAADNSWTHSAERYITCYRKVREAKNG